ncbi:MAG: hypothetical protein R2746_02095 [Acidimicrobiales bacterium]
MAVENPEHWPDAQRRFHLAYLEDPSAFPRHDVELVWITRPDTAWNLDVVTGRHDGVEATVTEVGGEHRSLRFAVAPDQVPPRQGGRVPGVLVGEWRPNATLCVEVEGGVVWPAYNPEEVGSRAVAANRDTAREQRIRRSVPSPAAWWQAASRRERWAAVAATVALLAFRVLVRTGVRHLPSAWIGTYRGIGGVALLCGAWYGLLKKDEDPPSGS